MSETQIINMFDKPKVIGVVADVNQGKSMFLYHTLHTIKQTYNFNLYTYGLRLNNFNATQVYSVAEIETIKNSIVVVDELSSLFDLDNRKVKKQIENTLRLINHNNNILVLCGVPENFKKFISGKLDILLYKKTTMADMINGCRVKNILMNYKGVERGSEVLNLPKNKILMYDGNHYTVLDVPYYPQYDSKKDNEDILKCSHSRPSKCANNVLEKKGFIKVIQ